MAPAAQSPGAKLPAPAQSKPGFHWTRGSCGIGPMGMKHVAFDGENVCVCANVDYI